MIVTEPHYWLYNVVRKHFINARVDVTALRSYGKLFQTCTPLKVGVFLCSYICICPW